MPNSKNKRNKGNAKSDKQKKLKHKMPASMIRKGNKREVVFDPEARRSHLRGFSERKRQRRAYGLAMQKVKDRKSKIEQRASEKKDVLERVEEAEKQKELWMEDVARMNRNVLDSFRVDGKDLSDEDDDSVSNDKDDDEKEDVIDTKIYDDQKTETTWGGQVTVTTSVVELGDDSSDDDFDGSDDRGNRKAKSVDTAQKYAGDVNKFMDELKGNMPGKKNRDNRGNAKRKGKDGASEMKGVGGSGNLKIASKLLNKSKDRSFARSGNGKKGKRRKR
ncbi:unnamed protein product [Pseudo-nitzschia multistriata]|uniref:Nucleolar protein 12 n=1 Tax=Pseudo-nitzschia multistriata TaxID=183589 RepID=A0A448ZCL6_9STRA|nr:unnamed protein product [Pseudo-nitzschia multistriata]